MKWYPLAGACVLVIGLVSTVEAEVYKFVDLGTLGGTQAVLLASTMRDRLSGVLVPATTGTVPSCGRTGR